ncbi:hypothetical protein AX769_14415 [Frondihabitans sp. PAMC 28766]|uniref:hypothetical protein n=1 Tax=Frondihabitans sp. PAMC 28766 TaxID=1795630 RepID=UPI00078B1C4C|nr:hypothetical protein [Frondihabitans sp. PAMC 28766]AMM21115.1 hypothetical protein AX769_14415 [Frondihabitans sp. PAMC 28766]
MSRSIKLRTPPRFTAEIVADARESIQGLLDDLGRLTAEHADDIEVWGSAVTTAGWEIARLGQWLGLEGEAVLLLGGASYPEIAAHEGTSASNVYNRVGKSLTLAPYAKAVGAVAHVSAESLDEARREYAAESSGAEAQVGDAGPADDSLASRIPGILRPGPATTAEIVAALPDYRRSSVLSTLSVLARKGAVARVGHGVYALPSDQVTD